MTSKHTPGPWGVNKAIDVWVMAGPIHVATIPRSYDGDWSPANANLIAAAPDLLAALKPFADLGVGSGPGYETETYRITREAIRTARAALARARGE